MSNQIDRLLYDIPQDWMTKDMMQLLEEYRTLTPTAQPLYTYSQTITMAILTGRFVHLR